MFTDIIGHRKRQSTRQSMRMIGFNYFTTSQRLNDSQTLSHFQYLFQLHLFLLEFLKLDSFLI